MINPCPAEGCPGVLTPTTSGGFLCNAGCGYRWEPIPEVVRPRAIPMAILLGCVALLAAGVAFVLVVLP